MPQPLIAGLPPNLDLWAGCTIRVTAFAPLTSTPVAGVQVSAVSLTVRNLAGGDLSDGAFLLVPGPSS